MEIDWCTVDVKTGRRGSDVPVGSGMRFGRTIGAESSTTIPVRCSEDGQVIAGWDEATAVGRTMLLAVERSSDRILWGGIVWQRSGDLASPWVSCTLVSVEAYLMRRYIKSDKIEWENVDPTVIAAGVVAEIGDLPPLVVSATPTGAQVTGRYYRTDDKLIGAVLDDLAGIDGGIEYTVDLEWADADHTQVRYVLRMAPRLGAAPGGPGSVTQWTMPGCVTGGSFTESGSADNLANDVLATSSGEGSARPESTRYEATELLAVYPRYERRFAPATSITSTQTLDQYAQAELARTRLGVTQLTITANLDAAPRVGLDWGLGDVVDVSITSERFPRRAGADGLWQAGYERRLRVVGWDLDVDGNTIAPRFLEAQEV